MSADSRGVVFQARLQLDGTAARVGPTIVYTRNGATSDLPYVSQIPGDEEEPTPVGYILGGIDGEIVGVYQSGIIPVQGVDSIFDPLPVSRGSRLTLSPPVAGSTSVSVVAAACAIDETVNVGGWARVDAIACTDIPERDPDPASPVGFALVNFAGSYQSREVNCLEFPSTENTQVDFGSVYTLNTQYTQFLWEIWVKWESGTYFLSEGYGGAHALLVGIDGITLKITGNFATAAGGASSVTFGGFENINPGEWHNIAIGWNLSFIEVRIDGVPSGRVAHSGQRWSANVGGGWYVGGSDHLNFSGRIAVSRLMEGLCPITKFAHRPDRFLGSKFQLLDMFGYIKWMADFTKPCSVIPDLGTAGVGTGNHNGRLCNADVIDATQLPLYTQPIPYWVHDAQCPVQYPSPDEARWGYTVPTPAAVPSGARIFDSFGRANQTRAVEAANFVGIGSTEGGSLGPLPWASATQWGIFKGRAIWLGLSATNRAICTVDNGVADMDVSVLRVPQSTAYATGDCGLVLRYVDDSNFVRAFLYRSIYAGGDDKIYVVAIVAGAVAATYISAAVPSSAGFGTMRVRAKTVAGVTTWTLFTDGVQIAQTVGGEHHVTATKCGMLLEWLATPSDAHGHARFDDFTVYETP